MRFKEISSGSFSGAAKLWWLNMNNSLTTLANSLGFDTNWLKGRYEGSLINVLRKDIKMDCVSIFNIRSNIGDFNNFCLPSHNR